MTTAGAELTHHLPDNEVRPVQIEAVEHRVDRQEDEARAQAVVGACETLGGHTRWSLGAAVGRVTAMRCPSSGAQVLCMCDVVSGWDERGWGVAGLGMPPVGRICCESAKGGMCVVPR